MKAAARANAKAIIHAFNFGDYLANNIDQRYPYKDVSITIGYRGKYSCEKYQSIGVGGALVALHDAHSWLESVERDNKGD